MTIPLLLINDMPSGIYLHKKGIFKHSKETKIKLSELQKGKHHSPISEIKKGQHISSKTEFEKGRVPWNKGLDGYKSGENHYKWNPNREEVKNLRDSGDYGQWKRKIKKRDKHRCFNCGENSGLMEIDHIFPWTKYPRLRFVVENGQTLCKECHKIKTKADRIGIYIYN